MGEPRLVESGELMLQVPNTPLHWGSLADQNSASGGPLAGNATHCGRSAHVGWAGSQRAEVRCLL